MPEACACVDVGGGKGATEEIQLYWWEKAELSYQTGKNYVQEREGLSWGKRVIY